MGNRTVVMLSNDTAHEWSHDPELGQKISRAMNNREYVGNYGRVVQCCHADEQTLAILTEYDSFEEVGYEFWQRDSDFRLKLLEAFADKMGYKLVERG